MRFWEPCTETGYTILIHGLIHRLDYIRITTLCSANIVMTCKLHDFITPTTLLNYCCKNEVNCLSSLSLLIERTIWLIAIKITIGLPLASFDRVS
jgi:hypothetical protein